MTTYFNEYPKELQEELAKIANAIVAPGKGILAADESTATCGKRFSVSSQCNQKNFRQLHFNFLFLGHRMRKHRRESSRIP